MQISQEFVILARLAADLVFWLLLAGNIVSMAIIAERCWFFWRRRLDADQLARHLLGFLRLRDLPRARALLLRYSAPECTVLLAGLVELEHGLPAATQAMKSAQAREHIRMQVHLAGLQAIAQAAALLGLLGTLLGVLGSLPDSGTSLIDGANAMGPALSGALAALALAAGGLCVAIPAGAASILFQRQVRLVLERSDVLMHLVLATIERQAAAANHEAGSHPPAGNAAGPAPAAAEAGQPPKLSQAA